MARPGNHLTLSSVIFPQLPLVYLAQSLHLGWLSLAGAITWGRDFDPPVTGQRNHLGPALNVVFGGHRRNRILLFCFGPSTRRPNEWNKRATHISRHKTIRSDTRTGRKCATRNFERPLTTPPVTRRSVFIGRLSSVPRRFNSLAFLWNMRRDSIIRPDKFIRV